MFLNVGFTVVLMILFVYVLLYDVKVVIILLQVKRKSKILLQLKKNRSAARLEGSREPRVLNQFNHIFLASSNRLIFIFLTKPAKIIFFR